MTIINADCLEWLKSQPDNSISTVVTDPPYGLKFMSKKWDYDIPSVELWQELLRVVKPGGMMLCFGGSRTYHRLTCRIEDAGWEIRDCIMWIYGSGFPKSHNHFGFEGYGTALKPSHEPIIMCMKPLDGTFKQNAEKWGVAGINIDVSRVPHNGDISGAKIERSHKTKGILGKFADHSGEVSWQPDPNRGRWPANIILDEEAGAMLDGQSGVSQSSSHIRHNKYPNCETLGKFQPANLQGIKDSGGVSRFFYCAKASSSERNAGLEGMPLKKCDMMEDDNYPIETGSGNLRDTKRQNYHPTVKPLKLMEYLIKLVMPPKDGILLDPFAGSGTTILAAQNLGYNGIGIEREKEYCEIAEARLKNANKQMKMAI